MSDVTAWFWSIFIWHFVSGFLVFCSEKFENNLMKKLFGSFEYVNIVSSLDRKISTWKQFLICCVGGYLIVMVLIYVSLLRPIIKLFSKKKKWWQ